MSGPYAWLLGLIVDPRFGVPLLLVIEATVLWIFWFFRNPDGGPPLGARRASWHRPEGDPVSRMYYALRDEQYSTLIRWSRERIEELYRAAHDEPLPRLPWRFGGRSDAPDDPYRLRQLTLDLGGFEWEARERETGLHLRWAFWRTAARDRARYQARVDRLLGRAQHAIVALGGVPT